MESSNNEKYNTTNSILKEVAHLPKLDLGLPSYDSLFSTEEERQEARKTWKTIMGGEPAENRNNGTEKAGLHLAYQRRIR